MDFDTPTLLVIHSVFMAALLVFWAIILFQRKLFDWTKAGFWAWAAFILYFVLNPLFSVYQDDLIRYDIVLSIAGGPERAFWILFVIAAGITIFFISYLRSPRKLVTWGLSQDQGMTIPMWVVLGLFALLGIYSLLVYRSFAVDAVRSVVIEDGRFTGAATGYEYSAFLFLFVPAMILLLMRSRVVRLVGWLVVALFIILSLPIGWGRYATVSMLLAASIADALVQSRRRSSFLLLTIILVFAVVLQVRGHTEWSLTSTGVEFLALTPQSFQNVGVALGSGDAAMLATFYLESFIKDNLTGFNYGIPLFNYTLTGWIPGAIFPDKYFLVDWLGSIQPAVTSITLNQLMFGGKSSLVGSFYGSGGLFVVLLMMWIVGKLSARLDGMLMPGNHILVQAVGVSWMSMLWMIWGSHDFWGLTNLGVLAIPGLALWIVCKLLPAQQIESSLALGSLASNDVSRR